MGLFRNENEAEKEVKNQTGGFLLKFEFSQAVERYGVKSEDGYKIQKQLKEEAKRGILKAGQVSKRIQYLLRSNAGINPQSKPLDGNYLKTVKCSHCNFDFASDLDVCPFCDHKKVSADTKSKTTKKFKPENPSKNTKKCPFCGKEISQTINYCPYCMNTIETDKTCPECKTVQKKENTFCIECGYEFESFKKCPQCGEKQVESNKFCVICGYEFAAKAKKSETAPKTEIKEEEKPVVLNEFIEFKRKNIFLNNQLHNLKTCPDCNTQLLKDDPFCFNCGSTVVTADTVKNDNLKVKDGKVVSASEDEHDELSKLESLYNQTVQSKYAPSFKTAYVIYLDKFSKNPEKKFPDKIAKRFETTENKLKRQAMDDGFVELAPAIAAAKSFKVTDLKDILKEHNLKVSGKKDDLIARLDENLSEEELKKYFKSKNYQISDKGLEFLKNNAPILYIHNNPSVSNVLNPVEVMKIFEEKEYDTEEIIDKLILFLKSELDNKLTQELWVDFKSYSNAVASLLEDKNNLKEALNIRFKVFIFDINNFQITTNKPDPSRIKLKQKDLTDLTALMHNLALNIDELKELFNTAYGEVLFKTKVTKEDSLIYLLKIFGGEDLESVSEEVRQTYSNPY